MTTTELRDKLLEKRAEYRHTTAELKRVLDETKEAFSTIDDSVVQRLEDQGFAVRALLNADFDEVKKSQESLDNYCMALEEVTTKLHNWLEESLHV